MRAQLICPDGVRTVKVRGATCRCTSLSCRSCTQADERQQRRRCKNLLAERLTRCLGWHRWGGMGQRSLTSAGNASQPASQRVSSGCRCAPAGSVSSYHTIWASCPRVVDLLMLQQPKGSPSQRIMRQCSQNIQVCRCRLTTSMSSRRTTSSLETLTRCQSQFTCM